MASKFGGIAVIEETPKSKFGGVPMTAPGPRQYAESMKAPLEAGLQMVTGSAAEPVAGLAGLLSMLIPGAPPAGDVVRSVRENMTYQPRTEAGQQFTPNLVEDVISATPELIKRPAGAGMKKYSQLEQSLADQYGPEVGAAMATLPTAILEAIPAGLAIKKMRNAERAAPPQFPPANPPNTPPAAPPSLPPLQEQIVTPAQTQALIGDIRTGQAGKIAPSVNPDDQILRDAEALGISLNPSHYSTNRAYVDMEQALKSRPGSLLQTQEEKAIIDLGNKADELIEQFDGSKDKSEIDETLRTQFSGTINELETLSDSLYKKVDDAIPKATRTNPNATRAFIEGQINDLGGDESLLTTAERQLRNLTIDKVDGKVVEKSPTYAALDRVRRDIGSALGSRSGPFKDDDTGQLRQLYSVLTEDQEKMAKAFGVDAEFKDAKALVAQRKKLEDQAITLFGRELQGSIIPKMRSAATALTKGDISKLEGMMQSVPEARRGEVAATLLNDLFSLGARRNAPIGQGFVSAFEGLNRNAGAKAALFAYLPKGAQERFDMIGRVATGIYKSKALENSSKTARDVLAALDDGGMLAKLYSVGKKVVAAEGVSSSVGLPGVGTAATVASEMAKAPSSVTKVADELLTSAAFRDAVIESAAGKGAKQAKLVNTPEYNRWLKAQNPSIKAEIGAIGFIPWLTSSTEREPQAQ